MFCSNCGNQLPEGARFCRECGAAQSQTDGPTRVASPDDIPTQVAPPADETPTQVAPPAADAAPTLVAGPAADAAPTLVARPTADAAATLVAPPAQTPPPPVAAPVPPLPAPPAVLHSYTPPVPPTPPAPPPPPLPPLPPTALQYGGGRPPRKGSSRGLWAILAGVGIVVIALAIALPLIFLRGGSSPDTTDTVAASSSTSVTAPPTSESTTETTEAPTTTSEAATTTTAKPDSSIPGDSAGTWVETNVQGLDQNVNEVAVSDDAVLFRTADATGPGSIYAYLFATGKTVQLPTAGTTIGYMDLDGSLAVWWEAEGADVITNAHIYAYKLPDGPKVEVASGPGVTYPHVVGNMITWADGKPWPTEPDGWFEYIIKATTVDGQGQPTGASTTLVDTGSAIGSTTGDSSWYYSLSEGFIAWEQQSGSGAIPIGTYMMDLGEMQPWRIDPDAWRPSLYKNRVVFTRNGVETELFGSDQPTTLDGSADFASAAPTYAAYFRPKVSGSGTAWAVVAKGYKGAHEQVLLDDAGSPPWLLSPIAVSAHRIAFAFGGQLHLFSWQ